MMAVMPAPFARTLRALATERSAAPLVAAVAAALLAAAWIAWMTLARVPEYRTSRAARLEVEAAPHPIAAATTGTVLVADLVVGRRVRAGDVLVDLDSAAQRIARDSAAARLTALAPEVLSVEREIAAEDAAVVQGGAAARASLRELLARQRAATVAVELAVEDQARVDGLVAAGTAPVADQSRARAEVRTRRAALEALIHQAEVLQLAERERDGGRRSRREQLERQRSELTAELAEARGQLAGLDHELGQRTLRAAVDGTLAEVAALRPGAIVRAGDRVATIVPDGELHVVADFGPQTLGRIAAGQPARVRLDGFPWTRWGSLAARVATVAGELRDGAIRVELALTRDPGLPLVHGMTATVDVEIDRTSPAARVLRAIGERGPGEAP
jgi:multidrug resistance efflux pump